ncbi:hypothetical protein PV726_22815 [Streptomyces europaeiscabiei]|uniref:hypothetical protein n=1 Tax=Streptomyces europaeiscabiei TaxID=146819 RepID=UPI0029B212C0|nr:hypothetical protein [Streptomyces europaeiscabiei]MDX3693126.1 hypothetical protein [Streptomyces europaeiscabiei]
MGGASVPGGPEAQEGRRADVGVDEYGDVNERADVDVGVDKYEGEGEDEGEDERRDMGPPPAV